MSKTIIDNCIKAIDKAKKLRQLNIFLKETFEEAIVQANNSKGTSDARKLEGYLMTVKDNISTKNIETTCGSNMLKNYKPPFNATVVDKLCNSGAIMLGKTNMDEYGMGSASKSFNGPVKNPWNLALNKTIDDLDKDNDWYISGGSSGGSAASVSAGIVDFSLGTDTGGSIRNPAAICGCIGYKPTYGLISRYGVIPLNNYFDTVGVLSQSVGTIVDVLNQIAGPDAHDATTIQKEYKAIKLIDKFDISKITFGIPKEFHPEGLAKCNLNAWESAVETLAKIGNVKFADISLPYAPYSMSCYSVLTSCEVASNFSRYDGIRYGHRSESSDTTESFETLLQKTRNYAFSTIVKGRILSGNYFLLKENYEKYFLKSQKIRGLIKQDFDVVFNSGIDIILTPSCFHETYTYNQYLQQEEVFDEKDFFTVCSNIAGVPAISLPSILSDKNLPVGVQFIANTENDELLLNVANWFSNNHASNFKALFL